jgi:hypothetical protein
VDKEHLDHWKAVDIFPKRFPTDLKGSRILVYQRIGSSVRSDEAIHQDMQEILQQRLGE